MLIHTKYLLSPQMPMSIGPLKRLRQEVKLILYTVKTMRHLQLCMEIAILLLIQWYQVQID